MIGMEQIQRALSIEDPALGALVLSLVSSGTGDAVALTALHEGMLAGDGGRHGRPDRAVEEARRGC